MKIAMLVVAVGLPLGLAAQETPPAPLAFEAASVKVNRNPPGTGPIGVSTAPGRFQATGIPLQIVIMMAYELRNNERLEGAPAWLNAERYDIVATTGGPRTPPETMAMLRSLLEERFKLVARRETRSEQVYRLVLARSDGRLGPEMKPSQIDCDVIMRERGAAFAAAAAKAKEAGQPPPPPTLFTAGERCFPGMSGGLAGMTMKAEGITMATLTQRLRSFAGRQVIDETGLTGTYDINLRFMVDMSALARSAGGALPIPPSLSATAPGAGVEEAPPLEAALREQLGLKLESQPGTADLLVIERIEKPAED